MRYILIIYFLIINQYCISQTFFSDSLNNELSQSHHDSVKVRIMLELSASQDISMTDRMALIKKAISISEKSNYKKGIRMAYYSLIIHQGIDKAQMKEYGYKALNYFTETNDHEYVEKTLNAMAAFYLYKGGDYLKSLELAQMNIDYSKKNDVKFEVHTSWNLIGEIYRITKNHQKALNAYNNSIANTNDNSYISPYVNIGTVYKNLGRYHEALEKYETILKFFHKSGRTQTQGYAYILNRIGQVYYEQERYKEAQELFEKSLKLYNKLKVMEGVVLASSSLTKLYNKTGEITLSLKFGKKAVSVALNIGYISEGIDEICLINANNHTKLNNYKQAYEYNKVYYTVRDSLFGPEKNSIMAQKQIMLETEKQQMQNQLLAKENELDKEVILRQYIINGIAIIMVIFLIFLALYLNKNNKTKNRLNKKLFEQKEEIQNQAQELEDSHKKILEMNKKLELLVDKRNNQLKTQHEKVSNYAFLNAHQLRGPLARILGILYLMKIDKSENSQNKYLDMLDESSYELDEIVGKINQILNE